MIVFDENFRADGPNYMIFELPDELHSNFKETKELKIKSDSLSGDAVMVSKDSTYQLKRNEISNTLAIAECTRDDDSLLGQEVFNIKCMKQYKIVCEKIFPPKKELVTYLKKRTIEVITLQGTPTSFTLREVLKTFPISEEEIYSVLKIMGVRFDATTPDIPIFLYSQELRLQCYNELVSLLKETDCAINMDGFILQELENRVRYPKELIAVMANEFLARDCADFESAKYSLD